MSVRLTKPWLPLNEDNIKSVGAYLGVFEIQDPSGQIVFIGFAGGKSLFGLRSELQREWKARGEGHSFRYEVNVQYTSRHKELLMVHKNDHGELPRDNRNLTGQLGRLHPG